MNIEIKEIVTRYLEKSLMDGGKSGEGPKDPFLPGKLPKPEVKAIDRVRNLFRQRF